MKKEKGRLVPISEMLQAERVTAQSVFRRRDALVRLEMMEMRERRIYCLIDGQRSIEAIALLLHMEAEEATQYIADLFLLHRCIELVPMEQRERQFYRDE